MSNYSSEYKQGVIDTYLSGMSWDYLEEHFTPSKVTMQKWVKSYLLANPEKAIVLYEKSRKNEQQLLDELDQVYQSLEQLESTQSRSSNENTGIVTDVEMLEALRTNDQDAEAIVYYQIIMTERDRQYLGIPEDQVAHSANLPVTDTFTYFHDAPIKLPSQSEQIEIELLEHNQSGVVMLQGYEYRQGKPIDEDESIHIDWLLDQLVSDGHIDVPNNVRLVYNVLESYTVEKLRKKYQDHKFSILQNYIQTSELEWI